MTTAKNHARQATRRERLGRPDFSELGKLGKRALRKRIMVLRASGPVQILEWVNEDFILRRSFHGLDALGQVDTVRVTSKGTLISEVTYTTTAIDLHRRLSSQLRFLGADDSLRRYVRAIIDKLAIAPAAWLTRIRRCPYEACEHPYFWDATDAGVKKHCSPAHKKAAARQPKR